MTVDPAHHAAAVAKRSDAVRSDEELLLARLRIGRQETVHHGEELHHQLVLTEIFVALEKELVFLAVTAEDCDLARPLLALKHGKNAAELLYANDFGFFIGRIRARHSDHEVFNVQKLRTDGVQLELGD